MKTALRSLVILALLSPAIAQTLTRAEWSTYAYEDMSDWIRRLPGMYPIDYGVAGAPLVFRPWGMHPWQVGVRRDGIPWNRVSDGLYDSNLDSPDELKSLSLDVTGQDPLATLNLQTRELPADTPLTEISLREGYYGFGRVDFAHAQRPRPRLTVEGRGRLWWYDGLRLEISKSRFYNLSGKARYEFSDAWQASFEYGGANVDAQSPYIYRPQVNRIVRPKEYSEREYGTARLSRQGERLDFEFGAHGRQDRITRDQYFGLQEQVWYGYVDAAWHSDNIRMGSKLSGEHARMAFPELGRLDQLTPKLEITGLVTVAGFDFAADAYAASTNEDIGAGRTESYSNHGYHARAMTPEFLSVRGVGEFSGGRHNTPAFWRYARYDLTNYPRLFDDAFADTSSAYEGAISDSAEVPINWSVGAESHGRSWSASAEWVEHRDITSGFVVADSTVYYNAASTERNARGMVYQGYAKLLGPLSLQTTGWLQLAVDDAQRAVENRSFSRLIFAKDFFKAPLHIDSYVAYEHIGTRRATSERGSRVLGPAHFVHFQIEGTIEGVTLIWGAENLTAQHYEYLPGYMLIRKEEYFGLRWTLRL